VKVRELIKTGCTLLRLFPFFACALLSQFTRGESVSDGGLLALEEAAVRKAVARVAPSVVRISTVGQGADAAVASAPGATTGLVVSADGHIVSSADRFTDRPESVLIEFSQGTRKVGRVVAIDHSRLIALLKVDEPADWLVPVAVPDEEISVGAWGIAVGRGLDPRQVSLSAGIVSARGRFFGRAIQTDAKVSSVNYGGPLIDIHGRVLGVLVALSPLEENRSDAGAQWYDSGIGFAIPLTDVLAALPRLSQGEDLHAGLLGVSLKPGHLYDEPAEVAAVPPTSPARQAGLLPGDRVIEIDSHTVDCTADLRRGLGRRYAGDRVSLVVLRGQEQVEVEVTLVDRLEPFQHAALGVLPLRSEADSTTPGVVIRYVFPRSPAAETGLLAGDRIVRLAGRDVKHRSDAIEVMNTVSPEKEIELRWIRRGAPHQGTFVAARLSAEIPAELPPARPDPPRRADARRVNGTVDLPLADWTNHCELHIPDTYDGSLPHGLVVWLGSTAGGDARKMAGLWKPFCREHELILASPQPLDPKSWSPHEVAYVREVIARIADSYAIDPTRVVVHGSDTGGAMACLVGLSDRRHVRGIVVVASRFPTAIRFPENDPVFRLSVLSVFSPNLPDGRRIRDSLRPLAAAGYPVEIMGIGPDDEYLNDAQLAQLVRWIDALDRF
jgi:serine protease Do